MVLQAINHMIREKTDYLERLQENITAVLEVRNLDSAESIDARMEQLQHEMMTRADNHESYGDIAEEIFRLREQKQQSLMDEASRSQKMKRLTELQDFIKSQSGELTEFDENIAKRLLERIDVMEDSVRLTLRSGGSTQIAG